MSSNHNATAERSTALSFGIILLDRRIHPRVKFRLSCGSKYRLFGRFGCALFGGLLLRLVLACFLSAFLWLVLLVHQRSSPLCVSFFVWLELYGGMWNWRDSV